MEGGENSSNVLKLGLSGKESSSSIPHKLEPLSWHSSVNNEQCLQQSSLDDINAWMSITASAADNYGLIKQCL